MSLLKWIQNTSSNPKSNTAQSGPISSATAGPSNGPGTLVGDASRALAGEGPDDKRFGMENFGNTCYANSVLQALYFCQPFRDLLVAGYENSTLAPTPSSAPQAQGPSNASAPTTAAPASAAAKQDPNAPPPPAIPSNPATLHAALRSLFYHIARHPNSKGIVAPQAFITKLKKENVLFRSSMHQDAHEFLNYLLNKVVEDLEDEGKGEVLTKSISSLTSSTSESSAPSADSLSRSPPPPAPPLIQSLFQGTLTNETRCLTCERVTSRSEPFLDLSLDISQNTSLNACLRHFSKSEMLTARNKFFCDECCGLVEAEKRMKIKTLPPILLLHLKRFKYQEELQKYVKLSYRVAFPLELRLYNNTVDPTTSPDAGSEGRGRRRTPHDFGDGAARQEEIKGAGSGGPGDPEGLYRLFAVVVHIGGGPHHGHYITLVKAPTTWLLFDDDSVEPIKETDIPKYFGDSTFTVEAAINAANATTSTQPAGVGVTGTAVVGGMMVSSGGLANSAKVLAANPAGSSATTTGGAKAGTGATTGAAGTTAASGQTGTATTLTTGSASMGSGYVLLYQAANIDLRGLGLISAAKEATEVGIATLEAAAAQAAGNSPPKPVSTAVPVIPDTPAPAHPSLAQIFVEEPQGEAPVVVKDVAGSSSPSFTSSSPSSSSPAIPTISPGHSPSHLTAHYPNGVTSSPSESATSTSASTGKGQMTNGRGLSLELPPSLVPIPSPLDDQLSPLALPPSVHGHHPHTGNGGFFKSLKHSASVNVGKHSGNGLGGFGLGLASPTALVPKDKEVSPRKSSSGAGASTPVLPTTATNDASHLAPPPPLPPMPPIPTKEKEKEKDKLSGWFSSARKSVKRRSRNKSKEKDENSKVGTTSFSSLVSDSHPSTSTSKLPLLDTNGYGGWPAANGGWVGVDGGVHGPASTSGDLPPGQKYSTEERRASEPLQAGDTVKATSPIPRPLSTVDPLLTNGLSNAFAVDPSSSENLARPESPSTPRPDGVLVIPRTATKSPSPKTPNGSVPPSPLQSRPSRYLPRKSLTIDQTQHGTHAFTVGVSPIPREPNSKEEISSNVLKRASRKMSLTSNSIRISGFGWNKDKDKDRS